MPKDPIVVMKFGGSVLKDADGFRRVADIIKAEKRKKIVVVSAMSGVTDELYTLVAMAINSQCDDFNQDVREAVGKKYDEIFSKHEAVLRELEIKPRPDQFNEIAIHLEKMITVAGILKESNFIVADAIVSQGEKFSASILSALVSGCTESAYLPAKELILMVHHNLNLDWKWDVEFEETKKLVSKYTNHKPCVHNVLFITEGFVAGNHKRQTVTLGRNGSDYTAAILGSVIKEVEEVQFWKDVDGVMTADPKLVSFARSLECIGYEELIEATRLGSKIIHPEAIAPLFMNKDMEIKVVVKNVNKLKEDGTEIKQNAQNSHIFSGVRMVTALRDLGIFSIHNSAKSVEYLAPKIYLALRQANVEFAIGFQGFSDQNATIIVHKNDFEKTRAVIDQITGNKLNLVRPVAQISVIGSKMRGKPGIAGKFFTALGNAGVNIINIQQGSSECSMAATINEKDVEKAIIAVHTEFDL